VLLAIVGLVYALLTAVPWWGNPLAGLVPQAYVVAGLVPVTVASFVLFGLPIIPDRSSPALAASESYPG
jgi:hypothetical protein